MAQTITIKAKMGHTFMALSLYNVEIGCNTKSLPNQGLNQKNSVCKVQAPTCLEKNSVYSPHFFRWNWNFIETLNFIKTTSVQVHPTRICPNDSTCALTRHLNFVICLTCCVLLLSRLLKNVAEKNQFHLIMLGWILENTGSMTILETMMNNYIYICTCTVFGGFTMFCLWHLGKKTQKNWVAIKLKSVRNIQHEPLQTWNGVPRYQLSPVQNTFSTGCFCMKEQTENLIFG